MPRKADSEFVRGLKTALRLAKRYAAHVNKYGSGANDSAWVASGIRLRIARERKKKGARK